MSKTVRRPLILWPQIYDTYYIIGCSIYIYYSTNKPKGIAAHPYIYTPIRLNTTTNASTTFTSSTLTDELIDDTILPTTTIDNRSDIDHHTTTSTVPIGDEEYSTVRIQDDLWNQRIQDIGYTKDLLPVKTYKRSQTPPHWSC